MVKIRIAIVGLGKIARDQHIPAPLQIVADAFLCGQRVEVRPFVECG